MFHRDRRARQSPAAWKTGQNSLSSCGDWRSEAATDAPLPAAVTPEAVEPERAARDAAEPDGEWLDYQADSSRALVHATLTEALRDVDAVCRHLSVRYWLHAGSLLGAVRQGSLIPWDDDIDLTMPREDLERFIRSAQTLLGDRYSVQTASEDPYIVPDAKVYLNGTHTRSYDSELRGILPTAHDGLFIDIFVIDAVSKVLPVRWLEANLSSLIHVKPWALRMAKYSGSRRSYRFKLRVASLIPSALLTALGKVLRRRQERYDGKLLAMGQFGMYWQHAFRREVIFPVGKTKICGLTVPAPADPDTYLTTMYGADYLTPPPMPHRSAHISGVRLDESGEWAWPSRSQPALQAGVTGGSGSSSVDPW